MHGVKRVLIFCIMIVILPATLIIIPLYLRKTVFADVTFPVAESDIIEIREGISSIFCAKHTLRMNSHFNAFQLRSKPEISTNRKHIRLKKSMTLPDDTLEYWGFYLLKGAKVHLKFCSRYDGSRILVVKGQRDLKTCGLLEHNNQKTGANFAQGHDHVKVFFEDITEIAENVPAEELEMKVSDITVNTTTHRVDAMELENNGGEDLSEEDTSGLVPPTKVQFSNRQQHITSETPIPLSEAGSKQPSRRPRKKLKKGSSNAIHNSKTEAPIAHTNYTTVRSTAELLNNSSGQLNSTFSGEPAEILHRSRRHHTAYHTATSNVLPRNNTVLFNDTQRQLVYDRLFKPRPKREHVYDRKYSHGGNAVNFTETDESNSISSFENGLFECYNGAILLAEGFPPSAECLNAHVLENGSHRVFSKHDITEDGYYYYIFYSDNDLVRNDIHAIFDIYKPTFQYSNLSDAQGCINVTNCTFTIGFLSDEIVVVEVPTRDGIEHEEDDITYLISTCHPRTEIYAIFPILVLVLILSCSFL